MDRICSGIYPEKTWDESKGEVRQSQVAEGNPWISEKPVLFEIHPGIRVAESIIPLLESC